jgi:hypothetical protein
MKGDVALAGFVFSAQDWETFEPAFRAELMEAAAMPSDRWVNGPAIGVLSGPIRVVLPTDADG